MDIIVHPPVDSATKSDHDLQCNGSPSSSTREPYCYRALTRNSEKQPFRLVTLLPGEGDSQLMCFLSRASLLGQPEFVAVSYTWGDPVNTHEIICEGASFHVTSNLKAILLELRRKSRRVRLWIDAICINQSDIVEKEQQILLMRKIYEAASRVVVCLGPGGYWDSWSAWDLIDRLLRAKKLQAERNDTRTFFEMKAKDLKDYDLKLYEEAFWALGTMMECSWFKRVWVIQELAVAKRAIVLWKGEEKLWEDFVEAIIYAADFCLPTMWSNAHRITRIMYLDAARCTVQKGESHGLLHLLFMHRSFDSTDLRDKIYALSGLANDMDVLDVKPSYSISAAELYRAVALKMLKNGRHLDLLSIPRVPGPSKVGILPSWVPDWSVSDFAFPLVDGVGNSVNPYFGFKATPESGQFSLQMKDEGFTIGLAGEVIDYIVEAGEAFEPDDRVPILQRLMDMAREYATYIAWKKIARIRSGKKYPGTGEELLDAYWRTLSAGRSSTTGDVTKTREEFLTLWRVYIRPFRVVPSSPLLRWLRPVMVIAAYVGVVLMYYWTYYWTKTLMERMMHFRRKMTASLYRRFFRTERGYLGLGSRLLREGDQIALFKGGMVPLVLRAKGQQWELVGDCFVHGIMQGEAFVEERCETLWLV
jgi:hypothetical protein